MKKTKNKGSEVLRNVKMNEDIHKKNNFKQSGVFRFIVLSMAILNVVYVSIVLYKSKISKPLLAKPTITEQEFF